MKHKVEHIFLCVVFGVISILIFSMFIDACSVDSEYLPGTTTELYSIDKYVIHEAGVEIWGVSETGKEVGFFVVHEKVFSCEEDTSRVVALYCRNECHHLTDAYLYYSESDFKEYIKEIYDID